MKTYNWLLLPLLLIIGACNNNAKKPFNFGFEKTIGDSAIGWRGANRSDSANYSAKLDSVTVKEGKYSASLAFLGGRPDFTSWSYKLSSKYKGDSVTVSGFMKTENVNQGYATIFIRNDPRLGFADLGQNVVKGTTGWTYYKVTLPLQYGKTESFTFGAVLSGKGKIWIDNFKISIDGKDLNDLSPTYNYPAEKDNEFDNGSQISINTLNKASISNLYKLGLIWGYLKYYHPAIMSGKYNWDSELFRILPRVVDKSNTDFNQLITRWVRSLGDFDIEREALKKASLNMEPDLDWLNNPDISEELRSSLLRIKAAKRSNNDQQYYATTRKSLNIKFQNEKSYFFTDYLPDQGYRLLALFRYWNMVQYFYPYKSNINSDWKTVLQEFIPRLINVSDMLAYKLTLVELTTLIKDSHAYVTEDYLMTDYFGKRYLPIKISFDGPRLVVSQCDTDMVLHKRDLREGDVILKIDDVPVERKLSELEKFIPASNSATFYRDVIHLLLRTNNLSAKLTVRRGSRLLDVSLKTTDRQTHDRKKITTFNPPFKWIARGVGYIDHGLIKRSEVPLAFEMLKSSKCIIIDMRNYPREQIYREITDHLLDRTKTFAKILAPNVFSPGRFSFIQPYMSVGRSVSQLYKGKVILLVNEITQSASEFHAMAYQTYDQCITIGSTTAGTDGDVSEIILPGCFVTRFSGVGIYYPDDTPTQMTGLKLDYKIRPTIRSILERRDELIEEAIKKALNNSDKNELQNQPASSAL